MRKKILIALLLLLLLFIWGNSCLPVSASSRQSGWILALLRPLLSPMFGAEAITHHFIRKLAHFTEFFALGLVICLLTQGGRPLRLRPLLFSIGMGLLAAFLDESIQIFSDRGDRIGDVWLDLAGAATGVLLSALALFLRRRRKRRANKRNA